MEEHVDNAEESLSTESAPSVTQVSSKTRMKDDYFDGKFHFHVFQKFSFIFKTTIWYHNK